MKRRAIEQAFTYSGSDLAFWEFISTWIASGFSRSATIKWSCLSVCCVDKLYN